MLKILGRSSSINVRKVLWTADELGLAYENEPWGTGFRSTTTPAFEALNPNALVPVLVTGADFTVADVVLGLSLHRWLHTPIERRDLPAVDAYYRRLLLRPAFAPHAHADVP